MHSNRTANFNIEEEREIKNNKELILKQNTAFLSKLNFNFNFLDEEEKEESNFSFKNDLLSKNAYEFIKGKDECLSELKLDDTIPNSNEK